MTRRFCKDDIETHETGHYGPSLPAVNVKTWYTERAVDWSSIAGDFGWDADELDRFRDWLDKETDEHPETLDVWWESACEDGWEQAGEIAADMFGDVRVFGEGRCGGWLVVDGLKGYRSRYEEMNDGLACWDAVDVARWGRFVRAVESIRDDTSYRFVWLVAANVWEYEKEWSEGQVLAAVL